MVRRLVLAALIALAAPAGAALAAPSPARAPAPPQAPPAPLSAEDQALVDRVAAYLDGIGQAQARFTQTDGRGRVTQGDLYLNKPGKARFEYDAPASMLIVSDGHQVMLYDKRLKTFENYGLNQTPLGLFLQRRVRLDGKVRISRVDRFAGGFAVTVRDLHKAQGQLTLTFSDEPIRLEGWTLIDAQGGRTTVALKDLHRSAGSIPACSSCATRACRPPIR
ncbi:MAG: outer membrane lipoprotein carrier protein LolA [Caulobacteraceae bacterium]